TGGYRSSIDKRSYDISKDLQTTTGSVADALRNVPSVDVDPQGNITLRGDGNVVIMVDGKPSTLFRRQSMAQALQSIPADQYERVEVMTNPSAAYSPNGSAGIINLITKKNHKPGRTGSIRVAKGSEGRWNTGLNGAYQAGKLTLSLNAGLRHD